MDPTVTVKANSLFRDTTKTMSRTVAALCEDDLEAQVKELIRTKLVLVQVASLLSREDKSISKLLTEFSLRRNNYTEEDLMGSLLAMASRCLMGDTSSKSFSIHLCNTMVSVEDKLGKLHSTIDIEKLVKEVIKEESKN